MKKVFKLKKFTSFSLKFDLKMKLTTLLLIVTLFQLQANESYGQKTKITLDLENVSVENVLDNIEFLTEFKFFYFDNEVDYKQKVSLKVKKESISKILKKLFANSNIEFVVLEKQITLRVKEVTVNNLKSSEETNSKQEINIKGTVVDSNGQPLPGANILEKGTTNGTQTDFDGNFSLAVTDDNTTLIVSYLGFSTKDIPLNGQTTLTISLEENASKIDDIVVIAYGSQSKRKLTGSISTVSSNDIQKVSAANTSNLIQGRAAGVKVDNNGGSPGASVSVVIRGSGTLGNDQPLYVVDGNILDNIDFLNSNDIKDFSVLKDAAAAALYGNRAANGVVLITTKKGVAGDIRVNVETKLGFQSPTSTLDLLNSSQYQQYHNAARTNDGNSTIAFDTNIDTDWQDLWLNNALFQDYSFNVSGGNENATFYLSGQHINQDGIVVDSDFKRYNFTINSNVKKGRFRLAQSLIISRSQENPNLYFGSQGDALPVMEVFDETTNGGFNSPNAGDFGIPSIINYYGVSQLEENLFTTDRVIGSLAPSFEIADGLTYKLNLGIDYNVFNSFVFSPTYEAGTAPGGTNDVATLRESTKIFLGTLVENTLNFNKTFGDHTIDVLAGFTRQDGNSRTIGGVGTGFDFDDFSVLGAASNTQGVGEIGKFTLLSYLGRINYDYKGKYLLGATVRRDGSSRFIEKNRWGTFPSFSAGWVVSEENFFPKDGIVNFLKFRGSYGELGSNNIADFATSTVLNNQNFTQYGSGTNVKYLNNPNLVWETTTTSNYALDAELFDGKLSLTAEYFDKLSEDILLQIPQPLSGGVGGFTPDEPSITDNGATISNKGFEFLATYRHFAKNPDGFNFNISANFTTINNELLALGEQDIPITSGQFTPQGIFASRIETGRPVSSYYGLQTEGLYQTQAEIDADGRTGSAQLGDINYVDVDGNNTIGDGDRGFLGSYVPDFEYGISFDGSYKNFDFTLFLQGVQGNEIFNANKFTYLLNSPTGNKLVDVLDAWTPQNTNTNIPRASITTQANAQASDYYVEDGSYLRFKTIQVGYTLPTTAVESIGMSNIRLYLTAQNLLTLTGYSGYDPEVGRSVASDPGFTSSNTLFSGGVDRGAYPTAKTVIVGVQLSF